MAKHTQVAERTPSATIMELIERSRAQVDRIVASVLTTSALPAEVAGVLETTAVIQQKLAQLAGDEKDCERMLARLRADTFAHMVQFRGLSPDECLARRERLLARLVGHLSDLARARATLERGIELSRTGLINRYATFAVAALACDGEATMASAGAFVVAYMAAVHLKDRLQTAGFRWAGEKSLVTLYLNAIGCERRRSTERHVADPVASVIATRIGFRSALELHRALHAMHGVIAGGAGDAGFDALEQVRFDRTPCDAFDRHYGAPAGPEREFMALMERIRNGPPR